MRAQIAALVFAALAVACASKSGPVEPVRYIYRSSPDRTERDVARPALGAVGNAAVGTSLVSYAREVWLAQLVLKEDVRITHKWDAQWVIETGLPAAKLSETGLDGDKNRFYEAAEKLEIRWSRNGKYEYSERLAGGLKVSPLGAAWVYWRYAGSNDYFESAIDRVSLQATQIRAAEHPVAFRRELIYTGRSGSTLGLMYREFKDDMARPAFSQALQYDIGSDPVIGYQGARFKVLSADNTGITYEVLAHLPPPLN